MKHWPSAVKLTMIVIAVSSCDRGPSSKDFEDLSRKYDELSSQAERFFNQSADQVAKSLPVEELQKLGAFEYRVVTLPLEADPADLTARLTALGADRWECFDTERRGTAELLVFCRRRPSSVLRYVPRSLLPEYIPLHALE